MSDKINISNLPQDRLLTVSEVAEMFRVQTGNHLHDGKSRADPRNQIGIKTITISTGCNPETFG